MPFEKLIKCCHDECYFEISKHSSNLFPRYKTYKNIIKEKTCTTKISETKMISQYYLNWQLNKNNFIPKMPLDYKSNPINSQ